jgi:hypothetical protein
MATHVSLETYRDDKYYPKIVDAVACILNRRDFVSPIDVLVEIGLLDDENVTRWKRGDVDYLERAIQCNLSKASRILRILRFHAHDLNLGPSITVYKHGRRMLQFSKSGARPLEEAYSRHFVVIGKKNRISNNDSTGAKTKSPNKYANKTRENKLPGG